MSDSEKKRPVPEVERIRPIRRDNMMAVQSRTVDLPAPFTPTRTLICSGNSNFSSGIPLNPSISMDSILAIVPAILARVWRARNGFQRIVTEDGTKNGPAVSQPSSKAQQLLIPASLQVRNDAARPWRPLVDRNGTAPDIEDEMLHGIVAAAVTADKPCSCKSAWNGLGTGSRAIRSSAFQVSSSFTICFIERGDPP